MGDERATGYERVTPTTAWADAPPTRGVRRVAPLYRRLPRGPNGMGRDAVARNQRARLYGGMVDSVARHGYQATTVADVIGLAGVSRRAFYEHFDNKSQCLSAAHNSIVGHTRSQAIRAWDSQRGWGNRLHASCRSVFEDMRGHPRGAHLVLVDSLGIAPGARERMRLASLVFERLLYLTLRTGLQGDVPQLTPCAIVGGIRHVAFTRIRGHREEELHTLADDVLDWIEAYRPPRAYRLAFRLPADPAPPQLPVPFLEQGDARARILAATAGLVRDLGYANFTDSQLARSARMPTQALHKHFRSKQACFLALLDAFVGELIAMAQTQLRAARSWPTAVHMTMTGYVDYMASHLALMRLAFVDLFDLGPVAPHRLTGAVERVTKLLTDAGPRPLRAAPIAAEAIAGAIWATVFSHAIGARTARLHTLADQLTFIVLAPYTGAKAAAEEILAARADAHARPPRGAGRGNCA